MNKRTSDIVRLSPENLDEIRASVDWQALFTGLGLRKAEQKSKPGDWWAWSPFHDEKTPSFHMAAGGVWYDFSIGEGGGPIELVQRLEGGNCYEAGRAILERGWAHASVDLSAPVTRQRDTVRRGVTKAVTAVTETESPENDPIRQDLLKLCQYHDLLAERGVSEETCDRLGIGYLPQGRSPLKGRIVFQVRDARVTKHSEGAREPVILSHLGRSVDGSEPKYLFYQGFHKSSELYVQELIWLDPEAAAQIAATKAIVLAEGPFDVAKAFEAGLRNVIGSFGASLSVTQARKLRDMADAFGAETIRIVYDRDQAGQDGAVKAVELIEAQGLSATVFDWDAPVTRGQRGDVFIPAEVEDLADMSRKQIQWLRQRGLL
jgi:DNA primase